MPVLRAHGITVRYGDRTVLSDVDLEISEGEIFGVTGPNGSGKSTLLRALCGLVASSGRIEIAGNDLEGQPAGARRHIGYVAQRFGLYPDLTVEENIRFYAGCHGFSRSELDALTRRAVEQLQLEPYRTHRASQLSHGWGQRLALAAAICHQPRIVFIDEATAGLDTEARHYFWAVLRDLAASGAAVLIATHYDDDTERCARLGRIREQHLYQDAA